MRTDTDLQKSAGTSVAGDLSDQLGGWLRRAIELADSAESEALARELKTLDQYRRMPQLRVAFVGEFARGKSTLINRLFGRSLLPVSKTSRAVYFTSIVGGRNERMEIQFAPDRLEQRPLEESSWADVLNLDQAGGDGRASLHVRLTVDQPWLLEAHAEFIDTPGVEDPNEPTGALFFDMLAQSDVVVLVVSAVLPLSMTEAAFLENEIIGRSISRIAVAVSQLDTIQPEERAASFNAVRNRVAKVRADIPVLPAHSFGEGATDGEALANILAQLKTWADQSQRKASRSLQVARRLAHFMGRLAEIAQAADTAAQASASARAEALASARAETRHAEFKWTQINLDFDRRRLAVKEVMSERIIAAKLELIEKLTLEASLTRNPRVWWEKELPVRLRHELVGVANSIESWLIGAITRDGEWLRNEVKRVFDQNLLLQTPDGQQTHQGVPSFSLSGVAFKDTQRQRLIASIIGGVATATSAILFGPIAMAVGIGSSLTVDWLITRKIEDQRTNIAAEIERRVDLTLETYMSEIEERLDNLYCQMTDELKREQNSWHAAREAAIESVSSNAPQKNWAKLMQEAKALQGEITRRFNQ